MLQNFVCADNDTKSPVHHPNWNLPLVQLDTSSAAKRNATYNTCQVELLSKKKTANDI
jgi:hypothetical protein